MKSKFILLLVFFQCMIINAQDNFNLELISNVQFNEDSNDIWGYVAPDGTEYAVVGTATHTRIYSLVDPANPLEIATIEGARSIWRDMKAWNEHIYVTTDQGQDGLTIIDMSMAPDSVSHVLWQPEIVANGVGSRLNTCHNLYIDENGVCYLAGCDVGIGGIILLDITTDPNEPIVLGVENRAYSHDVYVRDDKMYCSEINEGFMTVYDVSDKSNPEVVLGTIETSFSFCHNAWLSDDGNYVFTTDERANAFVDAYDVRDFEDMKRVDMFQPAETQGEDVIPHNTHVLGNFLVTSWYTDGLVITDATHPDNLIKVGSYDTWTGPHGGFNGCWGAYPFLPSGLVLASDIQTGLYVFGPTYTQAAYLEGTVTDDISGNPINGASVNIVAPQFNQKLTSASGGYKSGIADAGTYMVNFSHPDYNPTTLEAVLVNGEITILDAELTKLATYVVSGNVFDVSDNSVVPNAKVAFLSPTRRYDFQADDQGSFSVEVFEEIYEVVAGAWGYKHATFQGINAIDPGVLSFGIEEGYMDDFILDLDWDILDEGATTGIWVRDVPIETILQGQTSNIDFDMPDDIGDMCYFTGNGGGGAGDDDVDDGGTTVISDRIDASSYNDPVVKFNAYFFNEGGFNEPNDMFSCVLYDNTTGGLHVTEVIDFNTGGWSPEVTIFLKDYLTDFSDFNVAFLTADGDPGHIVEAAVDKFRVVESDVNAVIDQISDVELNISPNPFTDETNITWDIEITKVEIIDVLGRLHASYNTLNMNNLSIGQNLETGAYLMKMTDLEGKTKTTKLIKK